MRILCVGRNAYNIRGKKDAYYAWEKQCGNAHIKTCAFYAWEEMLIIYVGEKDANYAWANTRWACPHEEIRILCVGRNAYNILGKKRRILCMGKPHGGNAHIFSDTFYA